MLRKYFLSMKNDDYNLFLKKFKNFSVLSFLVMRIITEKGDKALEFIKKAAEFAIGSACLRDKCGTIIVKDDEIIGIGVNSPPLEKESQRRCLNDKRELCSKVTDKTCCIHAEQRAIMNALRENKDKIIGSRLYFVQLGEEGKITKAGKPYCTICSKMALDTGIKEFVLWQDEGICVYDTEEYNLLSYQYKE